MILPILSIICVWMFAVPLPWAVTITVFASFYICLELFNLCDGRK